MATVRELQASFIAKAGGMKSTLQGIKRDVNGLKKTTEQSAKVMSNRWNSMGESLQNQGKRITSAGNKIQGFGKKWTKVSGIVGAAAIGLGGSLLALTNKVTSNADMIHKHSQQMGVSTKFYQEMDFWASQNGISQEQME